MPRSAHESSPRMNRACTRTLPAIPLLLFLLTIARPQTRPLQAADILRVATVSDAQVSPSGEWIVYSLATVDGNETNSALWIVRLRERFAGAPTSRQPEQRRNWESFRFAGRPLLPAGWNAANPRWSPDGKSIAFVATRDGQRGIFVTGP